MKKSILAIAIAAVAASSVASAATVFDKDGTSLAVGGRVQAVAYSAKSGSGVANNDSTIRNSSRFNITGRSVIANGVSAFGFSEWNMTDNDGKDNVDTREQYVGVDFGSFGTVKAGRTYNAAHDVIAVTDIFESYACVGQYGDGDRNAGMLRYDWAGYGFNAAASYGSAKDGVQVAGYSIDGEDKTMNVESSYAFSAGYTTPSVGFGPIAIQAGYEYFKGQNDYADNGSSLLASNPDNVKGIAASLAWGSTDAGLYLAAMYHTRTFNFDANQNDATDYRVNGVELVASYAFDNGVTATAGWEMGQYKSANQFSKYNGVARKLPVYVNYAINSNFNVWAEAQFDVGSNGYIEDQKQDCSQYSVGARYTF